MKLHFFSYFSFLGVQVKKVKEARPLLVQKSLFLHRSFNEKFDERAALCPRQTTGLSHPVKTILAKLHRISSAFQKKRVEFLNLFKSEKCCDKYIDGVTVNKINLAF